VVPAVGLTLGIECFEDGVLVGEGANLKTCRLIVVLDPAPPLPARARASSSLSASIAGSYDVRATSAQ
jgi:hypothetical protein